jgi:succinyl-CoA synthetase alpha subunit
MRMSNQVSQLEGVLDALVGMATDLNKELLRNMGAATPEAEAAGPNDLIIGVSARNEEACQAALTAIDGLFAQKKRVVSGNAGEVVYESIGQAVESEEGLNMAVVSVPGAYAARECRIAMENGMNVFLFSDNVTIEEEILLKDIAGGLGLLMMGPDCGTAIINGVPLGFANAVRRGGIGIVAASGTGLQHVTCLLDTLGAGVSQAIGVGGRDLSARVGGRTALAALDAVGSDPETKVVVILSKPPAPEVAEKVLSKARAIGKPVVLCLFGREMSGELGSVTLCPDLEQTALTAARLYLGRPVELDDALFSREKADAFRRSRNPEQKYVRGIFCGGTVCDEAMVTFRNLGIPMRSNIPLSEVERLADVGTSEGSTFIDMGDDYFTRGKPHPMIDPSLRNKRIVADALMPDTAVMLVDVELGYGSHPDPAGILVEAVREANRRLAETSPDGRGILWIASLIGTRGDPQGFEDQTRKLLEAGFVVSESNVRAARLAASVIQEGAI